MYISLLKIKNVSSIFLLLTLGGCNSVPMYPLQKSNILDTKIRIAMPSAHQVKPEREFISDILHRQDHLLPDNLAKDKAVQFIRNSYKKGFSEIAVDENILFEEALHRSLLSYVSYMTIKTNGSPASVEMTDFIADWSEGQGRIVAKIKSSAFSGKKQVIGTISLFIDFKNQSYGGTTFFDIFNLSYDMDCIYDDKNSSRQIQCAHENDFYINDDALRKIISEIKPSFTHLPTAHEMRDELSSFLNRRYYQSQSIFNADKIQMKFNVDIDTARSKIKNEMDLFEYIESESTFIYNKRYSNPSKKENSFITHNFLISLIKNDNKSVVELSGSYNFFRDSYGGANLYGTETFESERAKHIALLEEILK